jgi:hypothetical protein
MISHKEPKFLLPIFPPFFLIIGDLISSKLLKNHSNKVKLLIVFDVILEILINIYFVKYHELGAFETINYIH